MKHIKKFESYKNPEIDKFNSMSKKNQIMYLVKNFALDTKEAIELCDIGDDKITVDDLPDELKDYFYE